jgi:hypothetical protein
MPSSAAICPEVNTVVDVFIKPGLDKLMLTVLKNSGKENDQF